MKLDNKKVVEDFFVEVYNNRNFDYVLEYFTDRYYEHRETGARTKEDALDILRGAFSAFPDLSCSVMDVVSDEANGFVRVLFKGTHEGEFASVPATFQKVEFEAMEQFKVVDGKISESWGAWPLFDIFEQMKKEKK